jgi:hypothetical protein
MGATSEFYEEHEFDVSDEVRRQEDEFYREAAEEVEDYYTIREMYKAVLGTP